MNPEEETRPGTGADPMNPALPSPEVVRVVTPGKPKFQLRPDERGISVFDPQAVSPPLREAEILGAFRLGSQTVRRSRAEIEAKGLRAIPLPRDPPHQFPLQ